MTSRPVDLPPELRSLFWEYDFAELDWDTDRDLIIGRILSVGQWKAVCWLLRQVGRKGIRQWIEERQGRALDPPQLRFWELVLGLPHRRVTDWIRASGGPWADRRGASRA